VSALREAASASARQPPGHGRYFALETESISTDSPRHPYRQVYWMSNGVPGWPAVPPLAGISLTWEQLQHLPTAPDRLLAAIAKQPSRWGNQPPAENEFATIVGLLEGAPASPALRSAHYRAAALLHGMRLVLHTRDLIGRAAAEVYLPGKNVSFICSSTPPLALSSATRSSTRASPGAPLPTRNMPCCRPATSPRWGACPRAHR
jgi:hypothetical protein